MKRRMLNSAIFLIVFLLSLYISYILDNPKKKDNKKTHRTKTVKSKAKKVKAVKGAGRLNGRKAFLITMNLILSLLIALAFGFEGIMQERYESFINRFSGDVKTDIFVQCSQNFARELQKSLLVNKVSELQREFPFAAKFSESQVLRIPMLNESEEYTVDIPIEIREYRPDKVPINEDIRGFIVNDTYYCNDDNSETSMVTYNYYKLSNYWLVLHTMEIRVTGKGGFTPDFTGATIMLREKKSQKAVILENSYQESLPIIFQCSTGEYILEIYKDRMIYTSGIFIDTSDKVLVEIGEKDHYYLSSVFLPSGSYFLSLFPACP